MKSIETTADPRTGHASNQTMRTLLDLAIERIYGAGISSSKDESIFALDDPSPNRLRFNLERVMRTEYRIDDFQQTYFVIRSYDELFRATVDTDFAPLYERLADGVSFRPETVLASDSVIQRGTQAYAKAKAKG